MFKLQLSICAIYGMFACQAIAEDTTQFVRGECNNMTVMESECDSFSMVRVAPAPHSKTISASSDASYNQRKDDSAHTSNNIKADISTPRLTNGSANNQN